ncbi:MAG: DUF6268 family outer membrane beta-barrel protein [Ferruginibacter sp.]
MKKNRSFIICRYLFILVSSLLHGTHSAAQPYLDIVNIKYTNSPNTGIINRSKNKMTIQYFGVGTNLPIQFKNKKDAVIISPFYENWIAAAPTGTQRYYSIALPVTLSKSIKNTAWSFLLTGILRMNDRKIDEQGKMQAGGAFILNNTRNENLTWKLGIYVNNEFFNVFVMPLAGIDWKINDRNLLFGVLPGNLTYEHRINDHFYYGACFRAITNSYYTSPGYWRINENQLGLYLDTYLSKSFVLNLEAGHSLLRKVETGIKHVTKLDAVVNDNFYIKLSVAYRVRLTKK